MLGLDRHTRVAGSAFLAILVTCATAAAQDRMPPIPAEKMTEAQKKAAAAFAATRNTQPTGPFAVMLRVPELMNLTFEWRQHVLSRNVLDQRQAELVILITARQWTQQYEWNAHEPAALKAGLTQEIVAAIKDGRRPGKMAEDEAVLYDLCLELQQNHSVTDATYARALAKLGEAGIVEPPSLAGYYATVP